MVSEYVEQSTKHDYKSSNEKLIEYVKASAKGYGLDTTAMPTPILTKVPAQKEKPAEQANPTKDVEGVKLEQTKKATNEKEWDTLFILAILLFALVFIAGIAWRSKKSS